MSRLNRIRWTIFGLLLSLAMVQAGKADVVVVVSLKCAASTLSKDQVMDIFLGKTSRFPDDHGRLELSRFLTPPAVADHRNAPVNALGYLRVMFAVDDIDETPEKLLG